jgi:hypothetical protein
LCRKVKILRKVVNENVLTQFDVMRTTIFLKEFLKSKAYVIHANIYSQVNICFEVSRVKNVIIQERAQGPYL